MKLIPPRKQVLDCMQLIQECCRDAVREQFVGGPDMIGETCRHRWGHRPPLTLRTEPSCRFGCWQWFLQPRVGKPQMVIGQGHPQLLLKPRQVLGKPIRTTGQAPIALALCEVVTLNKTGVHPPPTPAQPSRTAPGRSPSRNTRCRSSRAHSLHTRCNGPAVHRGCCHSSPTALR
jgi:hypothetical protein